MDWTEAACYGKGDVIANASHYPSMRGAAAKLCASCPIVDRCRAEADKLPVNDLLLYRHGMTRTEQIRRRREANKVDTPGPRAKPWITERVARLTLAGHSASEIEGMLDLSRRNVVRQRNKARERGLLPQREQVAA